MEELCQLLNSDRTTAERVIKAFHQAFICIMKTTCYELTPIESEEKIHFIIPTNSDHRIEVFCDTEGFLDIRISTTWGLQVGRELAIKVDVDSVTIKVEVDRVELKDYHCLNPVPVFDYCKHLVSDLHLPPCQKYGYPISPVVARAQTRNYERGPIAIRPEEQFNRLLREKEEAEKLCGCQQAK